MAGCSRAIDPSWGRPVSVQLVWGPQQGSGGRRVEGGIVGHCSFGEAACLRDGGTSGPQQLGENSRPPQLGAGCYCCSSLGCPLLLGVLSPLCGLLLQASVTEQGSPAVAGHLVCPPLRQWTAITNKVSATGCHITKALHRHKIYSVTGYGMHE